MALRSVLQWHLAISKHIGHVEGTFRGFQKWEYPNSWMVLMEDPIEMDDMGVPPWLRKPLFGECWKPKEDLLRTIRTRCWKDPPWPWQEVAGIIHWFHYKQPLDLGIAWRYGDRWACLKIRDTCKIRIFMGNMPVFSKDLVSSHSNKNQSNPSVRLDFRDPFMSCEVQPISSEYNDRPNTSTKLGLNIEKKSISDVKKLPMSLYQPVNSASKSM